MTELTTENLQDELQKMFDNSGGVFYKSGESEAILIVEPNKNETPYNSSRFMKHAIIATIIFIFIINLSSIINDFLFLKPTVKIGLKYGPKYNIAPISTVYLFYTFIVASLFMFSGFKIDNIFYLWGTFYLIVQFYLLISCNFQFTNIIKYDYKYLSYYILTFIGCVKGNYKHFVMQTILYLSSIGGIIYFITKAKDKSFVDLESPSNKNTQMTTSFYMLILSVSLSLFLLFSMVPWISIK